MGLYKLVSNLKLCYNITDSDYPLNIFQLCSCFEDIVIQKADFKTKDLRGMLTLAEDETDVCVILVNGNKSFEEQNYHGFHEFMHIFTTDSEPGTTINCFEKVKPTQNSYIEWLANEGAAEFLVPYNKLLPMVKNNYSSMLEGIGTYEFCLETAPKFSVSPVVIQNRINSLSYEIHQYVNGVSINDIEILSKKQLQQRNIVVPSLTELEHERLNKWFKGFSSKESNQSA